MSFPGKPSDPKPETPDMRNYVVELNDIADGFEEVHADYFSVSSGLVSFWQDRDGKPRDQLVIAYPIARIITITEGDE